ncbi:MAG: glycoside hydrolase family 16 protein [Muribaculaceae bacterium]|nr:glycoside hydrolase family 16 protein [Muribaculaceae bacterium]
MYSKLYSIIAMAAMAAGASAASPQTGSGETDGYRLVWQDLFDSGELKAGRWNIEVNGDGGGNNELQYYTDREENVRVGDDGQGNGCLILTARRENYNGKSFTSGRVTTKNLFAFKHGKVEAAIRFPSTPKGLWPAFWMMGNDFDQVGWPRSGEIDIVEMGHSNGFNNGVGDRFFNGACHWGPGWPNASYAKDATRSYSLQDGEFHLFTLIWDEEKMRMYVDLDKMPKQTPYFQIDIPQNEPDNEWSAGNYFHKENFILFNLAVGGNFPGIHNPADITALNDENGHQASMYVNYVKVYQKGGSDDSIFALIPGDDIENTSLAEASVSNRRPEINVCGRKVMSEGSRLRAFDIAGRCVAESDCCLDLGCMPAGLYVINATSGEYSNTVKVSF